MSTKNTFALLTLRSRGRAVRIGLAGTSVFALCLAGLATAPPANAGACSETGGENNRLMWTGRGYTCAYVADTGNNSIAPSMTETWTSNTAKGYSKRYNCHGQTGGVSISYIYTDSAGTNLGSSITYTAHNTEVSSRHWNAAVLWNTANRAGSVADDQFVHNCSTDKSIGVQQFYQSKVSLTGPADYRNQTPSNFKATVKNPDGGPTPSGPVYLFTESKPGVQNPRTTDCAGNQNNTKTPVDKPIGQGYIQSSGVATIQAVPMPTGTYNFYAVYAGYPVSNAGQAGYCFTPPQPTGLTPSLSNSVSTTVRPAPPPGPTSAGVTVKRSVEPNVAPSTPPTPRGDVFGPNPQLSVVNRSASAPNRVAARCRPGRSPVQISLRSPTAVLNSDSVTRTNRGAAKSTSSLPAGTEVELQLVCRPTGANAIALRGISWGSVRGDSLVTNRKGGAVFGGLGRDRLRVVNMRAGAWGGPGNDKLFVKAGGGTASAGPGKDRLVSSTPGKALLIGGPGRDTFIGGRGATTINALDGHGGDTIRCRSSKNIVFMDPGDRTVGPCTIGGQ